MKKQDNEKKDVVSLKGKISGWIFSIFVGCVALNIAIKLLAEVWLPLVCLIIFIVLLVIGYRLKRFNDWR